MDSIRRIVNIDSFLFIGERIYVVSLPNDEKTAPLEYVRWESVEKLFKDENWLGEWISVEFPRPEDSSIEWADDADDEEEPDCGTYITTNGVAGTVLVSSGSSNVNWVQDMTVNGNLIVSGTLTITGDLIVKGKFIA